MFITTETISSGNPVSVSTVVYEDEYSDNCTDDYDCGLIVDDGVEDPPDLDRDLEDGWFCLHDYGLNPGFVAIKNRYLKED